MSFRIKAAQNRGLSCRLPGCHLGRASLSPYCPRHAKAVERYGHPEGRALHPRRDYGVERERVEQFLTRHRDHPGVVTALKWIKEWMDAADLGEAVPGRAEMQRLSANAVPPLSILIEAAALFLLAHWNHRRLPDDDRLTFAIGVRVLSLAPLNKRMGTLKGRPRMFRKRVGKVPRREVGQRIRLTLAPLLVNIVQAIDAEEAAKKERDRDFRKPFHQQQA